MSQKRRSKYFFIVRDFGIFRDIVILRNFFRIFIPEFKKKNPQDWDFLRWMGNASKKQPLFTSRSPCVSTHVDVRGQ